MEKMVECLVRFGKAGKDNPVKCLSSVVFCGDCVIVNLSRDCVPIPVGLASAASAFFATCARYCGVPYFFTVLEVCDSAPSEEVQQ